MTSRTQFFFKMTQVIEPFLWLKELNLFRYDPKKLNFFCWKWLKELNLFFLQFDSNKWTYFEIYLKELNFFLWMWFNVFFWQNKRLSIETLFKMTHRIEHFLNTPQRIEPLFSYMTQRIEHSFFSYMTQRI